MKPKANFAHYITMVPLTDSMVSFFLRCFSPHSLIKQRKRQHTIIETVLLARKCKIQQSNETMQSFFSEVSLPTQLNQAKKMSNHYN